MVGKRVTTHWHELVHCAVTDWVITWNIPISDRQESKDDGYICAGVDSLNP